MIIKKRKITAIENENEYDFKVYHNATINQILSYSGICASSYIWTEELAQVS